MAELEKPNEVAEENSVKDATRIASNAVVEQVKDAPAEAVHDKAVSENKEGMPGTTTDTSVDSKSEPEGSPKEKANAQETNATKSETKVEKESTPVFTSSDVRTESTHSGSFFLRLLFILVAVIALPLCLAFALTGLSLILATLALFFACFVAVTGVFYHDFLTFFQINSLDRMISFDAIPYLQQYYDLLPEPYRFALAIVIVILAAFFVLGLAFLFLKLAKSIWHGMGNWRWKLSK